MNILFYLDQYPAYGGIETITSLWSDYFCRKGHSVVIVSHCAKVPSGFSLAVDLRVVELLMPDCGVSSQNRSFLRNIVDRHQIDVVVFQDSYARIEKNLFPLKVAGRPRVITVEHSSPYRDITRKRSKLSPREFLCRLKFPIHRILIARQDCLRRCFLYRHSDYYVLLSSRFLGEFRAITQLRDVRKLRFIPNATQPPEYSSTAVIANKEKVVVFVGSLVDLKGCRYLLEAWRKIVQDVSGWRLQIVGDGPLRGELEAYASGLPNVCFEGYRSDVFDIFRKAAVFAFPSIREGWGLVLVEAMSQGCVPVCFNSYSSVYDIVEDGKNGIIVPAFDVNRFADGLRSVMCASAESRLFLGRNAVVSSKRFGIESIAPLWIGLLEEKFNDGQ